MQSEKKGNAELYKRYPVSSLFIYNGSTILHFLLGGIGIILGYNFSSWAGNVFGLLYLAFAFIEMYVLMPRTVCPNCVYYGMEDSRCISGLNILSRRVAAKGSPKYFARRAQGLLCNNNLYMAALLAPILAITPALIVNFSWALLGIFLLIAGLMVFRIFVLFPKIACLHCLAKFKCPQAEAMGIREL